MFISYSEELSAGHLPNIQARGPPSVDCFLTLSNPLFLSTTYSPALICFGRGSGWWITCTYPTVLIEKNIEKQKEYRLRYLLAKVCTTRGKASDRLRQRANKRDKNRVGHLPTSEGNRKIILSDEVRYRIRCKSEACHLHPQAKDVPCCGDTPKHTAHRNTQNNITVHRKKVALNIRTIYT
jgi:hypothetical protein